MISSLILPKQNTDEPLSVISSKEVVFQWMLFYVILFPI